MGRVTSLTVRNYRSIEDELIVRFPPGIPVVLLGENNVGKSNVVRALDLVLGERWPGSWDPDDHDFYGRSRDLTVEITVHVEGVGRERYNSWEAITALILRYPPADGERSFLMEINGATENGYVSTEIREQCPCIVVGADRRLTYELSYATKYTLLSRVMKKFHEALVSDESRIDALKNRFTDVKELFGEVPEFALFQQQLQTQSDELVANLDYRLDVDFSAYDPSNYFHALRVVPKQGGDVRTFDELGTGQGQMLALAFAYAYAKAFKGAAEGLTLIIEEPEAHLHPLAQRWVAKKISALASEGVQVLVTTHSPAFLDIMNLEGMVLLKKDGGATYGTQFTAAQLAQRCGDLGAKTSRETILPFYAAAATEELLEGFFARRVVLVEGLTESLALPVLLHRVGIEVEREGIAIISCEGVGNLAKWYRMFSAFQIPVYAIFDNDSNQDSDASRRKDLLSALQVSAEDQDRVLNTSDWLIEPNFATCGVNYETVMRSTFSPDYGVLENKGTAEQGLASKPLIGRYVAENLAEGLDGWDQVRELGVRILAR